MTENSCIVISKKQIELKFFLEVQIAYGLVF